MDQKEKERGGVRVSESNKGEKKKMQNGQDR